MELTFEQFCDKAREYDESNNCSYISIGEYEGKHFAIFESWEHVQGFTAFLNGFNNLKGSSFSRTIEDLTNDLAKIEAEIQVKPDHWGLKRQRENILSHIAYRKHLETLEHEPIGLDNFDDLDWGFSDEYDLCCNHCGSVVRISPDCYSWTPPLWIDAEGYACDQCVSDGNFNDYILEDLKNEQKTLPEAITDEQLGLVEINTDPLESGWYPGMNDDPQPIIDALNNQDIDCWFRVYPQQFMISFNVLVKVEDEQKAKKIFQAKF